MKRIINIFIIILALCIFSAPVSMTAFASSLSDNAVITLSGKITEKEIVVEANLRQNTGINGMTAEISYDTSAMTLKNVVRGTALSALNYMTTNVETEKGYGITPFKINWSGDDNDASTGLLVTMYFTVNETATDGAYTITLKIDRDSVTYIDGGVKTKSALVDNAKVSIKGNSAETIVIEPAATDNTSTIILIVSLSVATVAIVIFTVLLIKRLKGKKAWTKIE